ncbi:MAG: DNA topoisomerase I [Firmicutes bacterium ADurb.Bin080]|jgi:hypothetical protein|nr:MAG: DNA topoisomerase I [Firmicutes bacterium ADurb.Bin080]
MVKRPVALLGDKIIGIETIYTSINGMQINDRIKLKELRAKSRAKQLFCPCGCGANLVLVAGDKGLREQHFRMPEGENKAECKVSIESQTSIFSRIVLKCWLDEKLHAVDIEARVPICEVDDSNRKYEFSFFSRTRKIALSYTPDRQNLSEEKLRILDNNSVGLSVLYFVDMMNRCNNGQYPESLMKVQERQGYCLLLSVKTYYQEAELEVLFYEKDNYGIWKEITVVSGLLNDFDIDNEGQICFSGETLISLVTKKRSSFVRSLEEEKERKKQQEAQQREREEQWRKQQEERQREIEEQWRKQQEEQRKREEQKKKQVSASLEKKATVKKEEYLPIEEASFLQQDTPVIDSQGNRWLKCKDCGKIKKEKDFLSWGGKNSINLGKCKECYNNPEEKTVENIQFESIKKSVGPDVCPECGGILKERNGQYGRFMGCCNYPDCRYTRKI